MVSRTYGRMAIQDGRRNLDREYPDHPEDILWKTIDPDEMWVLDKLILSRKMGYVCGPTGMDVPKPDWYIVRPCVNAMGLGLGAQKVWIEKSTIDLPLGYFWCEWFEGRHFSVDYKWGIQILCVEGFKKQDTFTKWDKWVRIHEHIPAPEIILNNFINKEQLNCEYIGDKLIEVHLRQNTDFDGNINEFIPVWEGQNTTPPEGFRYIDYPDVHGRIGAFVK